MRRQGLDIRVLESIKIAAVTVNPTSPAGYRFDPRALVENMQKAIPDIPVIDVME